MPLDVPRDERGNERRLTPQSIKNEMADILHRHIRGVTLGPVADGVAEYYWGSGRSIADIERLVKRPGLKHSYPKFVPAPPHSVYTGQTLYFIARRSSPLKTSGAMLAIYNDEGRLLEKSEGPLSLVRMSEIDNAPNLRRE